MTDAESDARMKESHYQFTEIVLQLHGVDEVQDLEFDGKDLNAFCITFDNVIKKNGGVRL